MTMIAIGGMCRVCGCSQNDACFDPATGCGCAWTDRAQTLCSVCRDKIRAAVRALTDDEHKALNVFLVANARTRDDAALPPIALRRVSHALRQREMLTVRRLRGTRYWFTPLGFEVAREARARRGRAA